MPNTNEEKRAIVDKLFGTQQANVNQMNDAANALEARPVEADFSPLLALADKWSDNGGAHLTQSYQKPMSAEEKMMQVAKLRDMASGQQQKMADSYLRDVLGAEKNEAMQNKMLAAMAGKTQNQDWQKELAINKMTQDAGKDMDAYGKARGAFAKIADLSVRASRLKTLIDQVNKKPGGATPQELQELAAGAASMVTNQNVIAQEQIDAMLPKGLKKDSASFQSYLLSKPKGANMQAFVDRLMQTVDRESKTADGQLRTIRDRNLPKHRTLYNVAPDRLAQLAAGYGIAPEELQGIFEMDPKKRASAFTTEMPVSTGGASVAGAGPSEDEQAIQWAKENPKDPMAAKILKLHGM